jgi:hypothetical protein
MCIYFFFWLIVLITSCYFHAQIYLTKENNPGSVNEGALLAVGGRYDYLLHQMWDNEYVCHSPYFFPSFSSFHSVLCIY